MNAPKVGALFAGYGGLELAVSDVFPGAHPAWVAEFEDAPARILAQRFPDAPNLGDVTAVDWAAVEAVDILSAGYPCQPFSLAGKQLGTADPRHLWPYVAAAMSVLRPMIGVFENVQGHLALGFDQVLRDLHQLGYDVYWTILAASSVGAPHRRNRLFILAIDRSADDTAIRSWSDRRRGVHRDSGGGRLVPGAPEGRDDGQGAAGAGGAKRSLRRSGSTRSRRHGVESIDTGVASHREGGRESRVPAASDAAGEGGSGGHRAGVRTDARGSADAVSPGSPLGCGVAGSGVDAAGSDPGGEPPRAGSGTTQDPRRADTESAVPLGLVVGAGERPIRPGGAAGEAAGEWCDDLGSRVRDVALMPTPSVADVEGGRKHRSGARSGELLLNGLAHAQAFGQYAPAIARWETVLGRPAPAPTEPTGKGGAHRLSPRFVEWLMGLPDGWVTDTETTRNEQLKALGNGVVPQQAAAAIRHLLGIREMALTQEMAA